MTLPCVDILAFSPHPDDAEIGCGGLLLLAARQGLTTAIVDLSEAEKSTRGTPDIRQCEKSDAAQRLGLACRLGLKLPDTQIGGSPDHEAEIVSCIRKLRPRLVLAPHMQDRHPDHEATASLVRRAAFFSGVEKVGSGEPHRIEQLLHYCIHQPFTPSLVFDVSAVWPEYENCLAAYQSQFYESGSVQDAKSTDLSNGGFLRALEVRGRHYGAMINAEFGEPYFSASPLRFSDPTSLFRPRDSKRTYGSFQ